MINIEKIFPLTEMQKGMLFHSVMEPHSGIYCEQFLFAIEGDCDTKRVAEAWQRVVSDNPILRIATRYTAVKEPVQIVFKEVQAEISNVDLSFGKAEVDFENGLKDFLKNDRHRGFNFETPHLIRAALIKKDAGTYIFALTYHHLILDAWSLFLLMKELVEQYDTGSAIGKVRPYYSDYVRALRGKELEESKDFWRSYLAGYNHVTPVADKVLVDGPNRNSLDDHREFVHVLSLSLSNTIAAFSKKSSITQNTLIQAAWAMTLGRAENVRDVVYGITITHRPHTIKNIDKMVGIFINSLPKRVHIKDDLTVIELLGEIQQDQLRMKLHEHVPLPEIQLLSNISRGQPIFESLLIFENFLKSPTWKNAQDFNVRHFRYVGWTNYPMAIEVMPMEDGIPMFFQVKYDANYLTENRIEELMRSLEKNLDRIVQGADALVKDVFPTEKSSQQRLIRNSSPVRMEGDFDERIANDLAEIWKSILKKDVVDFHSTFFEVGGHSLLLFELQNRIKQKFNLTIELVDLFDRPTIAMQTLLVRELDSVA
jgi:acyl carrier protein